jgi:hypothetical protein
VESLVLYIARGGSDPALQAEARRLALAWLDDRSAIDASMATDVLEAAAAHGDRALFDRYKATLASAKERRDRKRLYAALATFPDPQLAAEAFALRLSPQSDPREADTMFLAALDDDAGSLADGSSGRELRRPHRQLAARRPVYAVLRLGLLRRHGGRGRRVLQDSHDKLRRPLESPTCSDDRPLHRQRAAWGERAEFLAKY